VRTTKGFEEIFDAAGFTIHSTDFGYTNAYREENKKEDGFLELKYWVLKGKPDDESRRKRTRRK
jgi:hypothetical protein